MDRATKLDIIISTLRKTCKNEENLDHSNEQGNHEHDENNKI